MMGLETILSAIYGTLRAPGLLKLKHVSEELELIGLSATEKDLLALKAIADVSSSLDDALSRLSSSNSSELKTMAAAQKGKLDNDQAKAKQAADKKRELEHQKRIAANAAEQDAKRLKVEAAQAAAQAKHKEAEAIALAKRAAQLANPATYISEYRVLSSPHKLALMEKVNDSIKYGWSPIGGVCTYPMFAKVGFGEQDLFYQAMVKYDYTK